ncbi:MAG: DUF1990 family protein [Microbacterium sp.]|nr:DUF1990 family protein [Microbacterium sp.]
MPRPAYERGITRRPLADVPAGMRGVERTLRVPPDAVDAVAALVRTWEVKRRAGFDVPSAPPTPDEEGVLTKGLLGIRFREPVRVIWADGGGLGYETRRGHPLYGEESFSVTAEGEFSVRSISRPASAFWWLVSPALRVLQRAALSRYFAVVEAEAMANTSSIPPRPAREGVRPGEPK